MTVAPVSAGFAHLAIAGRRASSEKMADSRPAQWRRWSNTTRRGWRGAQLASPSARSIALGSTPRRASSTPQDAFAPRSSSLPVAARRSPIGSTRLPLGERRFISMAASEEMRSARGGRGSPAPTDKGVLLLLLPSVTDINGAGGVAARWKEYTRELEREGWTVELWTVDAPDQSRKIPRYHLANFPGTLTDSPGVGFMMQLWRRLNRAPLVASVVMTDLFSNVPVAMLCAGTGTPLIYSIHTDIAQLDGINLLPSSAAFLQGTAARLAHACVTTSPSFQRQLQSRGIRWCDRHYRPLPVDAIVSAADALSTEDVAATRDELTAGHPNRPVMAYVGRWSAEKRIHLLKSCRPAGTTLAIVGDGPMRRVVESWHDPPRVVVLTGMRPRAELARVYRATDWVASASAFETFGNVPYEAAHCGTPALLQDAQGFNDQVDAGESRGALLRFDAENGEARVAAAMDRTSGLLKNPARVRAAARKHAMHGTTLHDVASDVVERWKRGAPRKRRFACLVAAVLWSLALAAILALMKVLMVGCMWVGMDFTTGMAHQRKAKRAWRVKRAPSGTLTLDASGGASPQFGDASENNFSERRESPRGRTSRLSPPVPIQVPGDDSRGEVGEGWLSMAPVSPVSPARVLSPFADDAGLAAAVRVTRSGAAGASLATGRRRAVRL